MAPKKEKIHRKAGCRPHLEYSTASVQNGTAIACLLTRRGAEAGGSEQGGTLTRTAKRITVTILGLLLIAAAALWSCSDLSIQPPAESSLVLDGDGADGDNNEGPPIVLDNGRIDANDGGTVEISNRLDNSACRLIIPACALVADTTISADLTEFIAVDSSYLDFEFGPEGLQFLIPASLEIDVELFDDPELTHVDWYYLDPGQEKWSLQGQYEPVAGVIKIPICHFSTYRGISQGGQVHDPQAQ